VSVLGLGLGQSYGGTHGRGGFVEGARIELDVSDGWERSL